MVNREARHTVCASCTCNGHYAIEIQTAVEERVRQVDPVDMQRRDRVGTRREILSPAGMYEHPRKNCERQQISPNSPSSLNFVTLRWQTCHERMPGSPCGLPDPTMFTAATWQCERHPPARRGDRGLQRPRQWRVGHP